jgi:hypothetical protein
MTGLDAYRRAGHLADEAYKRLSEGDEEGAAVWAAVGQVYATLAQAAAIAGGETRRSHTIEEDWERVLGPDRPGEHPIIPGSTEES